MKFNFKKISAVAISTLLTGMTMGVAAAASYPAPFVSGGVAANTAVVYGTGQGVSDLDRTYGGNIQTDLQGYITSTDGSSSTISGGESFTLEKSSQNFNFGGALNALYSGLDSDEMDFLADGTYDDGSIDTDYEQNIDLSAETLSLFADSDYNDDEATVGFWWEDGEEILNYTIDFDENIVYTEINTTSIPLLGASYYVLSADEDTIEMLDTAQSTLLELGENIIIGEKDVTVDYIGSSGAKFTVDGETTDLIDEHEEYELNDGSYVVVTELLTSAKDAVTDQVEFSIGNGKITLKDGERVEMNDEDVDGLYAHITTSDSKLSSLTLEWVADDSVFLTESNAISMPGLGVLGLSYEGLTFPSDSETISVDSGSTLSIDMGNYDLPYAWYNTTGTDTAQLGEENYPLVLVNNSFDYADLGFADDDNVWWNGKGVVTPSYNGSYVNTTTVVSANALNLSEKSKMIVTSIDSDLGDVETAYYKMNDIDVADPLDFVVDMIDLIGDNDLTFTSIGDTDEAGDITVTLVGFTQDNETAILTFASSSGDIAYNKPVSEKGLVITLDTDVTGVDLDTTGTLSFKEANDDGDVNSGSIFNATFKASDNDKLYVNTQDVPVEETTEDDFFGYVESALASKITTDESGDEDSYEIEYFGEEVTAEVAVTAGGVVETTGTTSAGIVMITDTEAATAGLTKNLIIVGGSCINSAAAKVLGGAYCGAAFTANTGVGSGQFLIKSSNAYASGKIALVVAGYESADTVNAVNYLINKKPDTSKNYKGTSATVAEEIVTAD